MFIDQSTIFVRSGKGGDGCLSFRREKYIPKGGPDGGNGGCGGDVVLVGDPSLNTLLSLTHRPHYRAANGQPGGGRQMTGSDGDDLLIPVPLGTMVLDVANDDQLVADITEEGQRVIVARGGRGGFGNEHFKSATHQTPREFTPGEPWQERTLRLELRLLADVGLIGLPNAGKSTMLRALSRATPKVADYPFTTRHPHLGIATLPGPRGEERRLIIADNPGLIEGAAEGAGLGHEFLRHIDRTRLLVHVVDVLPVDESDPAQAYETIRGELAAYSMDLAERPEIVALNKVDLLDETERAEALRTLIGRLRLPPETIVIEVSGATGQGMVQLLEACWSLARPEPRSGSWTNPDAAQAEHSDRSERT